jgi:hypothetical protein
MVEPRHKKVLPAGAFNTVNGVAAHNLDMKLGTRKYFN